MKKYWPFLSTIVIFFLSVDYVVIPFLKIRGINGMKLISIVVPLATVELGYWYWFWGWLGKFLASRKTIHDDIQLVGYFARKYHWVINNGHRRFLKWLERGGHFVIILVGFNPEPFSRVAGVISCRILNWKRGFISLAVGNVFHTLYIIGGWTLIFHLFHWKK